MCVKGQYRECSPNSKEIGRIEPDNVEFQEQKCMENRAGSIVNLSFLDEKSHWRLRNCDSNYLFFSSLI